MKLEEIQKMWVEDSQIDEDNLDVESLNVTTKLHSKYLTLLGNSRVRYNALVEKKKIKIQQLTDYYEGKIDGKDIGREPWQIVDKTNARLEKRVDGDKEIVQMNMNIIECEERVLTLKEILTSINQRSFNIRNAIEFKKFINGQN
jgi:hypothetical protein